MSVPVPSDLRSCSKRFGLHLPHDLRHTLTRRSRQRNVDVGRCYICLLTGGSTLRTKWGRDFPTLHSNRQKTFLVFSLFFHVFHTGGHQGVLISSAAGEYCALNGGAALYGTGRENISVGRVGRTIKG